MSYQVIARKWRPQTFEEVTGQEAITRTLRNAVEHDRLHHAYIFSGSRGVGKTTTARLLAKALNCHKTEQPNPSPCSFANADICPSCREISESRSIDVFEFDAASHTGVDDIRELILEGININPSRDRFKIFIIDEVHMLSTSSFNALLKTLEEPPPRVKFIMATTELHKLPDTILSRCQEFEFRSIPLVKIHERLKTIAEAEKIDISDEALREIARSGEGSMRDAQSNFDQVISFSGEIIGTGDVVSALGMATAQMLTKTLGAIAENQPAEVLQIVDELIGSGQDLRNFCRDLLAFFRDLLVVKLAGESENLLDTAILSADELGKAARPFSESDLIRLFNSLSETESKLKDARQPRHILEIGLVKLIELRRVKTIENLLERLTRLEGAVDIGNRSVKTQLKPEKTDSEKKTLTPDFSADEIPFPVPSGIFAENNGEIKEESQYSPPEESSSDEIETSFENERTNFTSKFIEDFTANFIERNPVNLSPITSEELEHIEDNWLDAAYEKRLLMSGDELLWIADASKIVGYIVGEVSSVRFPPPNETSNSNRRAAFATAKELPDLAPRFEDEESGGFVLELSDDPTEQELRQYAENHPLVKKALRIFRGKIIDVTKLES